MPAAIKPETVNVSRVTFESFVMVVLSMIPAIMIPS